MTNRYARQIVLPEIGHEGQKKLRAASVLYIGAGGLGSSALQYLVAAGIGRIGLVDDDIVDFSNLQRQVLFKERDQGILKVKAAAKTLAQLNSECCLEPHAERFIAANAERLITDYDIIIDGTDNFGSKFLINDACAKYGKPLVYGSILRFEAQVSVFWAMHGPCYRCLYPKPPSGHIPNCAEAGIVGAVAGITGTVQALEAVKMALGLTWCREKNLEPLLGRLWILDAHNMQTRLLTIPRRPACTVCSGNPDGITLEDSGQVCVNKTAVRNINTEEAAKMVGKAYFIDVRETHELVAGKIPGALHIPLGKLLKDKDSVREMSSRAPIIVYCQHGMRSLSAASYLVTLGFTDVAHLSGGVSDWPKKLT